MSTKTLEYVVCDFCGKENDGTGFFFSAVEGTDAHICDKCVDIAAEVVKTKRAEKEAEEAEDAEPVEVEDVEVESVEPERPEAVEVEAEVIEEE